MELQGRLEELTRQGVGIAAVSYDPVVVLSDFAARRGIAFPLLSDSGSATIKQYGIFNTTIAETNAAYGIPFPGTFMLNARGVVTSRFFEPAYQERSTVNSMLARLGRDVDVPAIAVTSPQLAVTSFATDRVVAPGTHFSIVLDVRPAPGMHVYAPGVTGYKPIALTIEPQPFVLARATQYPTPEVYHFKPLNERVPVYQRPFRVVQDLSLDASPQAQAGLKQITTLTIKGVFSYQACDEKVCFTPQVVSLAWTVAVRPLDFDRVKR